VHHVSLTVTYAEVSRQWYQRLLNAAPVLDEWHKRLDELGMSTAPSPRTPSASPCPSATLTTSSFAFVEGWPFERWAARGPQTHAELATEVGLPLASLQRIVEAFGFARPEPGDAVVAAERPVAAFIERAGELGFVDEVASVRFGNLYAEALRRIAALETKAYHSGIEMPLLRSGLSEQQTMELAQEVSEGITELLEAALMAVYRRQQVLTWTEHQVEHIEQALEAAGVPLPPGNRRRCASSTWRATPD
jgi:hypothetical protein